jgi:hypothetical protein
MFGDLNTLALWGVMSSPKEFCDFSLKKEKEGKKGSEQSNEAVLYALCSAATFVVLAWLASYWWA